MLYRLREKLRKAGYNTHKLTSGKLYGFIVDSNYDMDKAFDAARAYLHRRRLIAA